MAVAAIIINYRSYDALERGLPPLEAQLAPGDEVVIVDHASDEAALERVARACPRARLLPTSANPGFAAGVNRGAAATSAEWLLVLNPDVVFEGPVMPGLADWLAAHPETGVVGPRLLNADGTVQPSARGFPGLSTALGGRTTWLTRRMPDNWFSRRNLLGVSATSPVEVDWISGACLMTPRRVWSRIGGFDEGFFLYWEDTDYCRRVRDAGFGVTYLPHLVARHPGGGSSHHDLPGAMRVFHRSAFRYYWKHAGLAGRTVAPLVWAGLRARGALRAHAERVRRR